jgi:hypothetical protein
LERFMGRVRLVRLPCVEETRGKLIELDHASLPFLPQRTFIVDNVPRGTVRGGHAHQACEQLLVCLKGRVTIEIVFNDEQAEIVLDTPELALYVAPRVWTRQRYDDEDSQLLVCASLPYNADHYLVEPQKA